MYFCSDFPCFCTQFFLLDFILEVLFMQDKHIILLSILFTSSSPLLEHMIIRMLYQ